MTVRPTNRFSRPGLALLAPAAERRRSAQILTGRLEFSEQALVLSRLRFWSRAAALMVLLHTPEHEGGGSA